MRRTILILITTVLIATGCGTPYTQAEKRAFALYTAGTVADLITTRQGLQQGCREMNFFLDDYPSDRELIAFKGIMTGILWGIGEIFPERREQIWSWAAIVSGGAAIWNSQQY